MTNPKTSPVAESVVEDLRPWGYAPGGYVFHCHDCPEDLPFEERATGDKRSWRCKAHAIAARGKSIEEDTPTDAGEGVEQSDRETLIAAGLDEYAVTCALRTESDGGFCHAYFYSDGQWHFQTGGHDLVTRDGSTLRCLLTKRLYAHPTPTYPGLVGELVEALAELQLAAFLAGRGSTRSDKSAPTMEDWRNLARTALSKAKDTPHG